MIQYLEEGTLSSDQKLARKTMSQADFHMIDDEGVLCMINPRISKSTEADSIYRVVPVSLRNEILEGYHKFGHLGINRLNETILRSGYKWPGMLGDIRNLVLSCKACSIGKRGQLAPKTELKPMKYPDEPGLVWQIDVMGPYHRSESGHIAILSIICRFSGYIWLYPLRDVTSATIAKKLFKTMTQAGVPKIIVSDNAPNLISQTMQELTGRLGIQRVHIAPYHSSSNAKIERAHRVIGDNLRALLVTGDVKKWNEKIPEILMGMRSAVSTVTKTSPFELWTGRSMRLPVERKLESQIKVQLSDRTSEEIKKYVEELKAKTDTIYEVHKLRLQEDQEVMKARYDDKIRKKHNYTVGETVFLRDPVGVLGQSRKLLPEYYSTEYEIVSMDSHNVRLREVSSGQILQSVVHKDRIKPCVEREEIGGKQDLTNKTQTVEIPKESNIGITKQSSEMEQKNDTADTEEAEASKESTEVETLDVKQSTTKQVELVKSMTKTGDTTNENISTKKEREIDITGEHNKQQKCNNRCRIVEQKGVGQFSKYRVQWRNNNGKTESEWQTIHNVDRELLDKWRVSHGLSGQTLKNHRRAGRGRPKRF